MAEFPSWQPLEGGSVPISDGAGRGRVVAVVASAGAVRGGWAAGAALDLARAWSASGHKIVLADAALDHPELHTAAALDNGEGLSDASLHGASVPRVARPVDDGAFFVVTAGSPVGDANSVAQSPRWRRLCDGFAEAGVTLILFVRDGDNGCEAFLASASDLIVFADQGEALPAVVEPRASMVRAVTGPSKPTAGAARATAPIPPVTDGPDAIGAAPPARTGAQAPRPAPARSRPAAPSARPAARHVILGIVVVVLVVVLLAVLGVIDIPMISPEPAGAAAAPLTAGRDPVAE